MLKRMDPIAESYSRPIEVSTWEGSTFEVLQADPVLTAKPFSSLTRFWPLQPAKLIFVVPGTRLLG